ncbi:unnamed protein product [Mytilus coruscus]|uniref:Uncharacterized protein n=1 Tax=Mytilus coruscus TaxID=42192 RepID=A0A6J8CEB0_MYTCO|nr:unnamed protein product [Mytilus coruscus]
MRRKDKEISGDQLNFVRKYKKYLTINQNKRTGNKINRRYSCSDLSKIGNEKANKMAISPTEKQRIDLKLPIRTLNSATVRKNSYIAPPIDFPYSYPEWHERVDNSAYADDGSDPRDLRKENLLQSLDREERNSPSKIDENCLEKTKTLDRSGNNCLFTRSHSWTPVGNSTSNKTFEDNRDRFNMLIKRVGNNDKSGRQRLPSIDEKLCSPHCSLINRHNSESFSRKVHFSPENDIVNIDDIDSKMSHLCERRHTFSGFRIKGGKHS